METTKEKAAEVYENEMFSIKVDYLREAYDRAIVKFVNIASKRGCDTKIVVRKGYAYVRNRKSIKPLRMTHDEVLALHEIKDRYRDIVDHFKSKGAEMDLHLGAVLRVWDTYSLEEFDETFWYVLG